MLVTLRSIRFTIVPRTTAEPPADPAPEHRPPDPAPDRGGPRVPPDPEPAPGPLAGIGGEDA